MQFGNNGKRGRKARTSTEILLQGIRDTLRTVAEKAEPLADFREDAAKAIKSREDFQRLPEKIEEARKELASMVKTYADGPDALDKKLRELASFRDQIHKEITVDNCQSLTIKDAELVSAKVAALYSAYKNPPKTETTETTPPTQNA